MQGILPKRSFLFALALLAASAAGAQTASAAISVTPQQARAMGLKTAKATAAGEAPVATLSATLAPPLNGRVATAVPYDSTVLQVMVLEGQAVRAGQTLAVLYSPQVVSLASELAQARAEHDMAKAQASRARQLASEGVIAGARAEEASARAAQARAILTEKQRLLGGVHASGASGQYALRAPIAGRVSSLSLAPGAGAAALSAGFVIDRTDSLWADARLPGKLVGAIRPGAAVEVEGLRGRVVSAGSAIDPRTGSAVLRAEIPNRANLAPGRLVRMTVFGAAPAGATSLPSSALTRLGQTDAVFVLDGAGYTARQVRIVGRSAQLVVVTGLRPGAVVAVSGVSQLKSALGR